MLNQPRHEYAVLALEGKRVCMTGIPGGADGLRTVFGPARPPGCPGGKLLTRVGFLLKQDETAHYSLTVLSLHRVLDAQLREEAAANSDYLSFEVWPMHRCFLMSLVCGVSCCG